MRLLGGEPTLHPEFMELVEDMRAASGLDVFVFTNGLWPDALHQREIRVHLAETPSPRVNFLFNVNEPSRQGEAESARRGGPWRSPGRGVPAGSTSITRTSTCSFWRD